MLPGTKDIRKGFQLGFGVGYLMTTSKGHIFYTVILQWQHIWSFYMRLPLFLADVP